MKKTALALVFVVGLVGAGASAALARKPGPGDKQCVPGQNGNPKPGHKAGVCPNPGK